MKSKNIYLKYFGISWQQPLIAYISAYCPRCQSFGTTPAFNIVKFKKKGGQHGKIQKI